MTERWFDWLLACPDCGGDLRHEGGDMTCSCGFSARDDGAQLDLRPQHPRARAIELRVGSSAREDLQDIPAGKPPLSYAGPRADRDSTELFSAASAWIRSGAAVLDLGCGPRDQAAPVQHFGASYVGVDYGSPAADVLADAHAIPFRADSLDAVLSYAVFEHLYNPFLAAHEVARVLRPGGVFFGVVSQGEPYHESFFHHTALGVVAMLRSAGLRPVRLWPSYDTLHALAVMGRYSKPQRLLIEAVHLFGRAFPFLAPRKHFRWSVREKELDELHRAASIGFVALKDDGSGPQPAR